MTRTRTRKQTYRVPSSVPAKIDAESGSARALDDELLSDKDSPDDLLPPLRLHILDNLSLDTLNLGEQSVELVRRLHLSRVGSSLSVEGTELHAGRGKVVIDDEPRSRLGGSDPGNTSEKRVGREGGFESCWRNESNRREERRSEP